MRAHVCVTGCNKKKIVSTNYVLVCQKIKKHGITSIYGVSGVKIATKKGGNGHTHWLQDPLRSVGAFMHFKYF